MLLLLFGTLTPSFVSELMYCLLSCKWIAFSLSRHDTLQAEHVNQAEILWLNSTCFASAVQNTFLIREQGVLVKVCIHTMHIVKRLFWLVVAHLEQEVGIWDFVSHCNLNLVI